MSLVSSHSYVGFNMALAFKLSHAVLKLGVDGLGGGGLEFILSLQIYSLSAALQTCFSHVYGSYRALCWYAYNFLIGFDTSDSSFMYCLF